MITRLNEQQMMLRKSSRDFLASECPRSLVRKMADDEIGYPSALWSKMAELGWLGLTFPEQYCGCSASFIDLIVLLEEMGRACLPGPFMASSVLSGMIIMEMGSAAQKKELLPRIADSSLIISAAITEPGNDWSLDKVDVRADADGKGYVINGTKILVPYAHVAGMLICLANTSAGPALLLVDSKAAGVNIIPLPSMDGEKQFEVSFNKVKTQETSLLGKVEKDLASLKNILAKVAVAICAEMVGGSQQVLEMTVEYVKERKQFGNAVGAFQSIQHHCANMFTDVETSRLMTYQAAARICAGDAFSVDAAMAKAWVNEAFTRVTYLSHQCIGGVAFMEDHDLPLFSRRAKTCEYLFGDSHLHREKVAQSLGL